MKKKIGRTDTHKMTSATNPIPELRLEIDRIDEEILHLLAQRVTVVKRIGQEKKKLNLPVKNNQREHELLHRLSIQAEKLGIEPSLIRKIWRTIFKISYIMEQ